ncbi:MAG: ABC transporter transmembrane domain-containing protein [Tepidisphaeraceae bacterium]
MLWSKLLYIVKPHRWWVAALVCLGALVACCDLALPIFNSRIVDHLKVHGSTVGLGPTLLAYALTFVGFACCIFLFIVVAGRITTGVSADLRTATFGRLQELPLSYFDRRAVGWLMSRLTGDCSNLSRVASWGMLDVSWGSLSLIGASCLLFYHNWKLALVVVTILVPLLFVVRWFKVRMLKTSRQLRKANSITTGAYNEGIVGVRTSKSLVREEQNLVEFKELTATMYGHAVRNAVYNAAFVPIVLSLCTLGVALALWRGGVQVLDGSISLGTLVLFTQVSMFVMHPAQELANAFTMIQVRRPAPNASPACWPSPWRSKIHRR